MTIPDAITAHPADLHVGTRIKQRRKELRVSQERLAGALGLTFQQVQKYERATNRVSASKLVEIARALHTPVAYFFEGLSEDDQAAAARSRTIEPIDATNLRMLRAIGQVAPELRDLLTEFAEALADEAAPTRRERSVAAA